MENSTNNPELLKKIKEKLHGQSPRSKFYGQFRTFLQIFGVIVLFLISVIVMSLFLYDLSEKKQIYEFVGHPIFENILNFLFELLIIACIGIAGIYFIYRNTDWPFVKERLSLLVWSFLIISLIGVGTVVVVNNYDTPLDDLIDNLTQEAQNISPLREYRQREQEQDLLESSSFIGVITLIEPEEENYHILTVESAKESKKFKLENGLMDLKLGDKVILHYDGEDKESLIIKIQKI